MYLSTQCSSFGDICSTLGLGLGCSSLSFNIVVPKLALLQCISLIKVIEDQFGKCRQVFCEDMIHPLVGGCKQPLSLQMHHGCNA